MDNGDYDDSLTLIGLCDNHLNNFDLCDMIKNLLVVFEHYDDYDNCDIDNGNFDNDDYFDCDDHDNNIDENLMMNSMVMTKTVTRV